MRPGVEQEAVERREIEGKSEIWLKKVGGKETERGVRTNRNVHFARLERLFCEVAGYIALSCKHALTASSC